MGLKKLDYPKQVGCLFSSPFLPITGLDQKLEAPLSKKLQSLS
jgi:hypothetical protein